MDQAIEDAKEKIYADALSKKIADINAVEYNRRLKEKREAYVDANTFLNWVIKKAHKEIKGFELSEKELEIYKKLALYFTGDKRFEENGLSLNKGIWMWGDVGCGKTTIMELFNENPLQNYAIVQCLKVADLYKQKEVGAMVVYQYSNLESVCFNDLGTEIESGESSNFGNKKNVLGEIVLNHYEMNKGKEFKFHFTTNLDAESVEKFYGSRVRSRLREMCNIFSLADIKDKRK